MILSWTCARCTELIVDGDPHTDPETGEDVHEACCASCHPELAAVYGIELDVTTSDLEYAAEQGRDPMRDEDGRPLIAGHGGGLTLDQAGRAELTRTGPRHEVDEADLKRRVGYARREAYAPERRILGPLDQGGDYELPTLDLGLVLPGAPCRRPEVPVWLFFPDPTDTETTERAKAVCATCRFAPRCLAWALAHGEHGVWGGTTDADRAAMRDLEVAG